MSVSGTALAAPLQCMDLLRVSLDANADDTALVSSSTHWTWRELDDASSRLAANLLNFGLQRGDRVASLMPNRDELLVFYLACMKAGFIATPLNYRYQAPEIDHALEVSGASLLIAHAERDADLLDCQLVEHLQLGVIQCQAADASGPTLEELIQRESAAITIQRPEPNDPVIIFFTSGSTGRPKGVTHSLASVGWMLASTAAAFEMTADDVVLPGSSVSHLGSFLWTFAGFGVGAKIVLAHSFVGDEILPLLREHRPTVLCMLPAALFCLVREHGANHEDFTSLRLCRSGSDKVPAELEREFTKLAGFPVDEGYGCTEAGLATLSPPSGTIKLGSVGRPVPGFELSVRRADGSDAGQGEEGGLWIKSQSTMVGYWDNDEATRETIIDGWLDTGDVMRFDTDGYFWFCGRSKQIIVHDGSNICPQEVEESLLDHPAVAAAGVVGLHDIMHGENVRAYVTLKPDIERPRTQELIQFSQARVGYKAPEDIVVLDEMPLNATGKIDRVTLKELAASA